MLPPQFSRVLIVLFVDASADAGGDGSSWSTAFQTIQAAINAAEEGDEV